MKQFDCSVFDGPILGIISRVFDVRRDFLAGHFSASSMFDIRFDKLGIYFFRCSMFDKVNLTEFIELDQC